MEKDRNHKFSDAEKISLRELGKISKFLDNPRIFADIEKVDGGTKSIKLRELLELRAGCKESDDKFRTMVEEKTRDLHSTGDLVVDVAADYHNLYDHKKNLKTRIRDWITPYTHAAVAVKGAEGMHRSHIMDKYYNEPQSKSEALISRTFRIYPDRLIYDRALKKKLCEALGLSSEKDLEAVLQTKYEEIAAGMHMPEQFVAATLENSEGRKNAAGIADFKPSGHRGGQRVKSWAQSVSGNAQTSTIGSALSSDTRGEIICSEFVAKMTVLALHELDKELTSKIKEKDPSYKGSVITMPFNEKEDLSKVHPYRLIKQLQLRKAVVPIQNTLVEQVVRGRS